MFVVVGTGTGAPHVSHRSGATLAVVIPTGILN